MFEFINAKPEPPTEFKELLRALNKVESISRSFKAYVNYENLNTIKHEEFVKLESDLTAAIKNYLTAYYNAHKLLIEPTPKEVSEILELIEADTKKYEDNEKPSN